MSIPPKPAKPGPDAGRSGSPAEQVLAHAQAGREVVQDFFTGFALEAGTPEFLCKGVCLGGALHRNPGMKRTETRDFGMSLLLRRRPRRAKAAKPRIWRAGLPCIGRADPSDGSRWHNYLAVSFFLRLKLQSHSDLR